MEVWRGGEYRNNVLLFATMQNGSFGGIECEEWRCHRKGGNVEKERKTGSLQGTGNETKSGILRIP